MGVLFIIVKSIEFYAARGPGASKCSSKCFSLRAWAARRSGRQWRNARHAATACGKAADVETARAAIDLKVLIEQVREQIQNIE